MLAADGRVGKASIGDVAPATSSTLRHGLPWRALVIAALLALTLSAALLDALGGGRAAPLAHRTSIATRQSLLKLPLSARAPVSSTLGAEDAAYAVKGGDGRLTASNPAERLNSSFTGAGASISSGGATLGLSLRGVGYGATTTAIGAVAPHAERNRVLYSHAGVGEWYANGPLGLEQGFTVAKAPGGRAAGAVTLSLAISGNTHARLAGDRQSVSFVRAGKTALRYTGLSVTDARGRKLISSLALSAGELSIHVQSGDARFPLHVDPFVQSGGKLVATDAAGEFGFSVAVSGDGSTAIVGAPWDNLDKGVVWTFARSGASWTQQGGKLSPAPAEPRRGIIGEFKEGEFGSSVAISANGEYAVIGASGDLKEEGAAWFYKRSGSSWTQLGGKRWPERGSIGEEGEPSESEESRFGTSVAISADGTVAMIGAPTYEGSVFTYKRTGEDWSEGPELFAQGELGFELAEFGTSIALSEDGTTALIGGPADGPDKSGSQNPGAAWVFTRSGSAWSQTTKLTASEALGEAPRFGASVALAADGDSALIGGPGDSGSVGAAWAFAQSGGAWAQRGAKLTASDESGAGKFGASLSLSADGSTALIGSPSEASGAGAARLFTHSGEAWSQAQTLLASGESAKDEFGFSLALSGDGQTAAIGSPGDGGGDVRIFVTGLPGAVTGAASSPTKTSATLSATVNPNGAEVTGCQFEYGTSTSYGKAAPCSAMPGSGTAPVAVSGTPEGLTPATPYHFRISATNASGTNIGEDATFTTLPNAPSVETGPASLISSSSATLNGTVDPNSGEVVECKFEYGTSTSYETSVPCATSPGSGAAPVAVSAAIGGLHSGSAYHFRLIASNAGGTGTGADAQFTATSGPPEFGTCVKVAVGLGAYANSGCTKAGGKGDYEWSSSGALGVKLTFSGASGAIKLTTADKTKTIVCGSLSGAGEYSSVKTLGATLTLGECELSGGGGCHSAGEEHDSIVTAPLEGALGVEARGASAAKDKLALDLSPATHGGDFAEFTCGSTPVVIRGSVIAPLKANKMLASWSLAFKASKQLQRPESLEGTTDVLEESFGGAPFAQLGLAAKSNAVSAQPVEASSVA